jgi:hypothetical protein
VTPQAREAVARAGDAHDLGGGLAPIPRVALTRDEAARALGMGLDSFERYVHPHVRVIRRGRLRLIPVEELRRWANEAAERTLP